MSEHSNDSRGTLVWDLPARVCHWGFALSSTASLWIGLQADPESTQFQYHILAGVVAGWFVLVRLVLGLVGSSPLRLRLLFRSALGLPRYLLSVLQFKTQFFHGPNPGTAVFALCSYASIAGLIWTGFTADWAETWHGWLAKGLLYLICAHLLGLTLHAVRHRRWSPLAMIHGHEIGQLKNEVQIVSAKRTSGIALALVSSVGSLLLWRFFDPVTSTLRIPGLPEISLHLIQKG